ncbi:MULTISPECIES: HAD-IIA family hydrolase [Halolamina]|uniref:4-nitrophenyl phosphatase n=1 Tax=Halolamina pelagica TaxID=699431 RepID=A0A1I5NRK7_9EURY|nr:MULTISPECIES: HAD-IIA family hydrolase [Halolamina]NHX36423.1 HAD-IIA family hydrolase [Halolamina sp. R1-12]SFP23861.1 4-nitrophenyl phosphatase [Halolamina pelagica]
MVYQGAILDVDGTVLRGEERLPGAADGLAALDTRSIPRLFVSNNPTRPPTAYAEKLRRAGVDAAPDEILTAGASTVAYLGRHYPSDTVYLVGERGLREQLESAGFDVVVAGRHGNPERGADVAVVSLDREFDYDTLTTAVRSIRSENLPVVGTDPDAVIPAADGDVPGSGSMIASVTAAVEREPEAVLGKPHGITRELALDRLDCEAADCLVVGDRLDTDIALGAGEMTTVLVRSGVRGESRIERSPVTPDFVVDSLADIGPILDGDR